jgi:hypothetical protein
MNGPVEHVFGKGVAALLVSLEDCGGISTLLRTRVKLRHEALEGTRHSIRKSATQLSELSGLRKALKAQSKYHFESF